ncbi:MAG: tetratricopeptide repeat protein [Planctomycetes bacterium]|nr:tetratricopeptide repeat protein [Planctomycetota bacterium]
MPDTRKHRGRHPDDDKLFSPAQAPALQSAVADLAMLLTRGDALLRQGDVAAAFGAFERAYRREPSSRRLSKFAELAMHPATAAADQALERPDYAQIIETITSFRETLDDEPILRSVYARALDAVGRRDDALQQMALAYHEHHDQIAQGSAGHASLRTWYRTLQGFFGPVAVEQFVMELCEQKPDLPDLRWLAGVWAEQGADGISRAIELQRGAVEQGPEDDDQLRADLYLDLGNFLLLAQDIDGAIAAFEASVGFDADDAGALNNLAYLTTEIRDDPQKALPYAQRAVELKPDDAAILDTLGWVHFKLGNLSEAQEYLRRSIERLPLADNHVHLAAVLAATGYLDRARTYLRRATELNPGPSAQTEIDRLAEELRTRGSGPDARRVRP